MTDKPDITEQQGDKDPLREKIGHVTDVAGTEVGHGALPAVLIFLFIFLMIWAAVSWIPPAGTY